MKGDLQKQIPKLFAQRLVILPLNGIQHLVGFLNERAPQGKMGLLRIPWAAPGPSQPFHNGHQIIYAFAGKLGGLGRWHNKARARGIIFLPIQFQHRYLERMIARLAKGA
ncbi:hypothetical protein SDC9_128767 [bioreactor metagenome]|uniref:Uncharacterized protein n=1 Tax=bioreactor metagenome TaxID=1076179 RepID=A0A645CX21_9ZZZZ